MTLYRNTMKPLYKQLKDALKQNITKGKYKPNDALPGERQLMEIYGVSRMTVRQAIAELVSEGVLYRRQGSGTYVNPKTSERLFLELYGLVEELSLSGYDTTIELIESNVQPAVDRVREELQLGEHESVFFYERLIKADGIPMLFTTSQIPHSISTLFDNININIARDVIYEHLELCGYHITDAIQRISAGYPTVSEARYLECDPNSPVLVLHRTTYLSGGHPIIFTRAVYRQEYQFTLDLKRGHVE